MHDYYTEKIQIFQIFASENMINFCQEKKTVSLRNNAPKLATSSSFVS